ncbi:MAG TPA: hypothetical protein ENO08_02870 [Candidatus Eisenbacteria bacterium]|uniref:DUF2490 domain-containing protein n=1 Tax=Eiseniibacteriota bacterium TaxID=2212470 RepID=A0A7V2F3Y4_UNCEI|nr:hypothetical protein [Candidatus Eisenbacteria bacterium]
MVGMKGATILVACFVLSIPAASLSGEGPVLDVEAGGVMSGYNDVRIPGTTGTLFSLVDDLETDPSFYYRVRISYVFADRHTLSLLAAPLRLEAEGSADRAIVYEGETFGANERLEALYRFDSYRLTYRYDFRRTPRLRAGIGLTAKIRDASIRVESAERIAEKENTGLVPLLNFHLAWRFAPPLGLLFEGDALAAPQGRAEDILLALFYDGGGRMTFRLGYRLLEGGADNDEVYSFALLHYAVLGASFAF